MIDNSLSLFQSLTMEDQLVSWLDQGVTVKCAICPDGRFTAETQFWIHIENDHKMTKAVYTHFKLPIQKEIKDHRCKLCKLEVKRNQVQLRSHLESVHPGITLMAYFREFVREKVDTDSQNHRRNESVENKVEVNRQEEVMTHQQQREENIDLNEVIMDQNNEIFNDVEITNEALKVSVQFEPQERIFDLTDVALIQEIMDHKEVENHQIDTEEKVVNNNSQEVEINQDIVDNQSVGDEEMVINEDEITEEIGNKCHFECIRCGKVIQDAKGFVNHIHKAHPKMKMPKGYVKKVN